MVEVGAVMPAELALPAGSSTGVGRVFEEAARQGIATVVLQPGEADPAAAGHRRRGAGADH